MKNKNSELGKKLRYKTGDTILTILFFISAVLAIWGINIYQFTIIDTKYLFGAIIFGIIISFATLTFLLKSSYTPFWTFLIKAGIGGGLFYFGLLFFNQRFADKEFLTEDFQIIKTGTFAGIRGGCSQPYVVIDFYGAQKQLVFSCDDSEIIKHSSKVILTYSKGAFGFNYVKTMRLSN